MENVIGKRANAKTRPKPGLHEWRIYTLVFLAPLFFLVAPPHQGIAQSAEWLPQGYPVVSWTNASNYVGQHVTVEGTIDSTYYYFHQYFFSGTYFLVFHQPQEGYFYGIIFSSTAANFKCSITQFYLNKTVRITGTVGFYDGAPEITVNTPSQIEVAYQGFPCS